MSFGFLGCGIEPEEPTQYQPKSTASTADTAARKIIQDLTFIPNKEWKYEETDRFDGLVAFRLTHPNGTYWVGRKIETRQISDGKSFGDFKRYSKSVSRYSPETSLNINFQREASENLYNTLCEKIDSKGESHSLDLLRGSDLESD